MANIVIKDLSENVELDRQAMLAVIGGSRLGTGGRFVRPALQKIKLFDQARIGTIQPRARTPAPR